MILTPNGWPASRVLADIGVKGFILPGTTETVWLRADVAPLLLYWARRFNVEVEDVQTAGERLDEWGYAYRANRNNPSRLSEHSAGTALDLNAVRHPNGKRGTFSPAQTGSIDRILADINRGGQVLEWGGNFHSTVDEMHVDLVGTLVQVKAAIARLRILPDGTTDPIHRPPLEEPAMATKSVIAIWDDPAAGVPDAKYLVDLDNNTRLWMPTDADVQVAVTEGAGVHQMSDQFMSGTTRIGPIPHS